MCDFDGRVCTKSINKIEHDLSVSEINKRTTNSL